MTTNPPAADSTNADSPTPIVGILVGGQSDLRVMNAAAEMLRQFQVPFELTLVSPHRTPHRLVEYAESARKRGIRVIIAGGGGAAHLPGMVAAFTTLPVIGVPINGATSIGGLDSILSMLQMPTGVPVATVALDNAANAAVLAVAMLALSNARLADALEKYRAALRDKVMRTVDELRKGGLDDI